MEIFSPLRHFRIQVDWVLIALVSVRVVSSYLGWHVELHGAGIHGNYKQTHVPRVLEEPLSAWVFVIACALRTCRSKLIQLCNAWLPSLLTRPGDQERDLRN